MNNAAGAIGEISGYRKRVGAILLLGLLFIASSWWRLSELGFYSDDWIFLSNTAHSPTTLVEYLKINRYARPVYSLIAWSLNMLAVGSAMYWQVISSATVLASAVVSYRIIAYTAGRLGYGTRASILGGIYGAAVLFFSPWMLAVFVWSTGVLTLWSFVLFGTGYLIIEQSDSIGRKCAGSFLVLAGFLTYEAYWFAFVPLLLISKPLCASRVVSAMRAALWYIVPLGLAVIYQQILVPSLAPGGVKTISPNSSLILDNLKNFDHFISQAIAPIHINAYYLTLLALVALLVTARFVSFVKLVFLAAALGLGVIFTAVIHGAVGYGLAGTGVMSRTMAAPGFYFAVLMGILAASAADGIARTARIPRIAYAAPPIFVIVLVLLLCGFVVQMNAWTTSKGQSKKVLDTLITVVDRAYLLNSLTKVAVVVQLDGDPNGEIFGASWELSGAVALAAPELVPPNGVWFLPARQSAWGTVWDGKSVIQTVCSAPPGYEVERRFSHAPPLYYRIDPRDGKIIQSGRLIKDTPFGCDGIGPTLAPF